MRVVPPGVAFQVTGGDFTAVRQFMAHRFDLLGSGWVQVRHAMTCAGFEGIRFSPARSAANEADLSSQHTPPNRATARQLRGLLSPGYQPIDWHIDFRSGFRWSERTWYRDIPQHNGAGVDIKVPWELSRMQHLPELALAYSVRRDDALAREFADQVLDWIAANPPRFGVNWSCTMDVAIRLVNWLVGFDLFRAAGAEFAPHLVGAFTASAWAHARHIARNLEWSETHTANHYLANVCGLLIAAIYLPPSRESDGWLLFALQEVMVETGRQFLPDGGHYEASTTYHALCAEMIAVSAVWAAAIPQARLEQACQTRFRRVASGPGLDSRTAARVRENLEATGHPFSRDFFAALRRAAHFSRHVARPDGSTPLIGDHDSGRFLRLGGWVNMGSAGEQRARFENLTQVEGLADDEPYPEQTPTASGRWLGWADAFLPDANPPADPVAATATNAWLLGRAITSRGTTLMNQPESAGPTRARRKSPPRLADGPGNESGVMHRVSGSYERDGSSLFESPTLYRWDDFGLFVVRTRRVHLVIRCGWAMWDDAGVHAHEDQLSFDLTVEGERIAEDPGTYVYTPSPTLRQAYRRSAAHCAPSTLGPTSAAPAGVFAPPTHRLGVCLEFNAERFVGRTTVGGGTVTRTFGFFGNRLEIVDVYRLAPGWRPAGENPFRSATAVPAAPNYGWRCK